MATDPLLIVGLDFIVSRIPTKTDLKFGVSYCDGRQGDHGCMGQLSANLYDNYKYNPYCLLY